MKNDFYLTSGFLSVFRNDMLRYLDILGTPLKVTDSTIYFKIKFAPRGKFLVKVFSRVFNRVLSTTRNAAASRQIRNIYHDKMLSEKKQIHSLLAEDFVESLLFIIKKAAASSTDLSVAQQLTQCGKVSKLALFCIQYVRCANMTWQVPLTNYSVNLESDCSSIKSTKSDLNECMDLLRTVDLLTTGDETSLISINLGHLDKTVPGFCSTFLDLKVSEKDGEIDETVSHELLVAKGATSFDVSMAILLGLSCENFDPNSNYADVSKVSIDGTELSRDWSSELMEFFLHMLKIDLPAEVKVAIRRPLMADNQWKMVYVGESNFDDTDINTSG